MDWTAIIVSSIVGGFIFRLLIYPVSKRIGLWLVRKTAISIQKGLGIQELTEKVEQLGIEVDSKGKEQSRLRKRIVKLEKALSNPSSSRPESKDEARRGDAT